MIDISPELIDRLLKGDMTAYDELFPNAKPEDRARTECFIKMATQDDGKHLWLAIVTYLFAPHFFDGDDGCRCYDRRCPNRLPNDETETDENK